MIGFPALLLFWGLLPGSGATCTTAYGDKIRYCKTFQTDYIEGIEILIFEEGDVGLINSTLFSSPNLRSVLSLTLKGSKIHTIESGALQQFQGLSNIELQDNSLTTFSPTWFHDSSTLKNLTVANNLIGQLRPEMLEGFSNLERLNLSRNQISSIHGESFWSLSKTASLDLSYNKISSLPWKTLSPLNGTLRLGGNPWNCSCAHKDFIIFLKELMNASRLADANLVTCRYPPDLMGALVWNVSEMNCSSPSLPPLPEAVFHKVVLPVLFVVLVLFLFILLIFLFWKKKQDKKQVQPDKRAKGEANTRSTGRSPPPFGDVVMVNANQNIFKTASSRNSPPFGRAKSAAAILLQAEFNPSKVTQSQKWSENSQCPKNFNGNPNPKETSGGNVEMWYYNSLQGKVYQTFNVRHVPLSGVYTDVLQSFNTSPMEDISTHTPIVAMGPVQNEDHSTRSTTNTDALEPLVYLCMNTTLEDPKSVPVKKAVTPNNRRNIRRTLSWPNVQYKKDSRASYEDFLKTLNISPKPSGSHNHQQKSQKTCKKRDRSDLPDTIQVIEENKVFPKKMDIMKDPALGSSSKKKMVDNKSEEKLNTTRNVYQRSSNGRRVLRSKAVTPDSGVDREGLNSQGSDARSELRSTPDDDQLLENNEYHFIDLLHEVVENHGRWTRERWRQTHQQRMSSRTSPHS